MNQIYLKLELGLRQKCRDQILYKPDLFLVNAHNVQTDMLTQEAQGNHVKVDLYMVHAQDHLMTAITFIDLAKEVVAVYKKMAEK